ncbi:MAG: iron ABC transporter substrate-binding protein [Opitutae bacterium]|nr:iron ABC transporter substrate-binding protein [Opitutae bacterium]
MRKQSAIFALIGVVVGLPFILREEERSIAEADEAIVIISPHMESIRHEFAEGFRKWYKEKTGKTVQVDWRTVGGTSEIAKFIDSEYVNSFRNHWTGKLGKKWNEEVASSFNNRKLSKDAPAMAREARKAFLDSKVGIGVDLFFGGGQYDFYKQAQHGHLVDNGLLKKHPDWFADEIIPQRFAGEQFYDKEGRWIGATLSSFGILYNRDVLATIGKANDPPSQWIDLCDPAYFGRLGIADPTKSGSVTKAFEMIVQQQMQMAQSESLEEEEAVAQGWVNAMRIIQLISANARYFSGISTRPVIDCSQGDCAASMCIDFYGRFQEEAVKRSSGGESRLVFLTPKGGSTVSCDPIGMLRGAPHAELAQAFITYVLSKEGQNLWNFKVGEPGGPEQYALRRAPIRRDAYKPNLDKHRSDPEMNPYHTAVESGFVYHGSWTGRLFSPLRFIIKTAFIDPRNELVAAWAAIIQAEKEGRKEDAAAARKIFADVSRIDHGKAKEEISGTLSSRDKLAEVQLAKELTVHFRNQYQRALSIAQGQNGL